MFCFQCGKEIPGESRFCLYCGARVSEGYGEGNEGNAVMDPLFAPCFGFLEGRIENGALALSEVSDAYVKYCLPPERFLDFYHQIAEKGIRIIDDSSDLPVEVADDTDGEYSERDAFADCLDELTGATDHGTLYINDVADFYDDHALPAEWYDEFLKTLEERGIVLLEDNEDVTITPPDDDAVIQAAAGEAVSEAEEGKITLLALIEICMKRGVEKEQFETVLNRLHEKGIEVVS